MPVDFNVIGKALALAGGNNAAQTNTAPTTPTTKGGDPNKDLQQTDNQKFGNWLGTTDTKAMASDLMKRGMDGANQIYYDNPNPNDPNSVKNSQGDWKIAAIQQILANAKKDNIRTPEEVMANKHSLIGNSKWSDAIDNPTFNSIHKNFWQTISNSLLPDQWKKYDAEQASKNNVAKAN
jgi:hypothetical protein